MIRSSSANRAKTTPMVSRPLAGTSATAERTTLPPGENDEHLVVLVDDQRAGEVAAGLVQLGDLDAEPAAVLDAVLVDGGALRVAALGDDEHEALVADDARPTSSESSSRKCMPFTPEVERPIGRSDVVRRR